MLSTNRNLNHFFSVVSQTPIGKNHFFIHPDSAKGMHIGNHLSITGKGLEYNRAYVYVTSDVVDIAEKHLIAIDYDEIFFELIIFEDEANLWIKYGQILGSHLLAVIDLNTLPAWITQKEPTNTL